ncbi:hypothetical protein GCM10009678_00600 [Actinomadura kijaniata]|uniref:non-ribosomal peptide synthetase n=1 Tax=Actinomadura kijaniata TaxID=46161 RepID=UPI002FEB5EFD
MPKTDHPLSFAQRGLWFLDRLNPGDTSYNVPFVVRLTGALDVEALTEALGRVVARHEILRTTFPERGGEPYQRVADPRPPVLPLVDLTGLTRAERDRHRRTLVDAWAAERFDLAAGPLMRVRLLRLDTDEHLLVVVLHHIVCDAESMHLLFDELADHYGGAGTPTAPPAPPVQYGHYAAEQRRRPVDEGELAWWRRHLAGAPTAIAPPGADRPRPAVRGTAGATHVFRLPEELAAAVGAFARARRSSAYMVLLAAYAALLGRLSGNRDLLVGTPVGGRSGPELESLIGFFVTTVPVRADLTGDPTFEELVARLRAATLAVLEHQGLPFEALVEGLGLERDPSHTPLVQVMFTFDPRPLAAPRFAGLTAEVAMAAPPTAKFDLDFMIVKAPDGRGLEVTVNYSTELYDAGTIERLAARFTRLLTAAIADPALPVASLPLLDDREEALVTRDWARGRAAHAMDVPVHELFARQAARTPDAPAACLDGTPLSYADLDARADRLARRLRAAGTRRGDVVGIMLPRGLEVLVALLGVLKAGAAYLPLDAAHPPAHLERVLGTAGGELVITGGGVAHRLDGVPARVLDIDAPDGDQDGDQDRDADRDEESQGAAAGDLAYTIFTSGSTGAPKGVGVSHGSLANHARAMREMFGLTADDRVLQFAGFGFDVAAEEIFPTWLAGGCVVALPGPPPPPRALTAVLEKGEVTVANLPASYWQQWAASLPGDAPSRLRLLVVGSENVDAGTLRAWCRRHPVPVINAYGLTETTVTAVAHRVQGPMTGATVPIGSPIDGLEAYVLDEDLRPVPPGVGGELYLGGAGLARGYLDRPDLTAERFVPHPFADGRRLHRTGDRARWRHDGALEVLGRLDEQLKVRGYRVEPAEVEAALCAHPQITRAVGAARGGPADGDRRLVGYVVPRSAGADPAGADPAGADEVPADLLAFLAGRLPVHLVPSALVALAALPMTAGGKVDRSALPEPPAATATARPVPAGDDTERRIAAVWQEVLDLDRVGVHDNFFDLGGNSFALAAAHARLTEAFEGPLPLVALYEHPTIAALARHLTRAPEPRRPDAPAPEAARLRAGRARLNRRRRAG